MIKIIAAIYSRKSRLSDKGESIQNQIEMCKKYGENIGITDFIIYEDEGFSGGNTNRPQFQKLIKDAKKKRFKYLICYKLDRISRNVADFSSTLKILDKYEIDFISIKEQFDTSSVMGRAMMNISATFAQMERETIAERIKDNMLELSKTGRWLGGTAPLGYKSVSVSYSSNGLSKKMFKLEIVPEEMEIVQLIYSLFLSKRSCSPIARYLCSNSIKGKNGGDFSRNTVLQIINNPVYCICDENIINYFKDKGATIVNATNLTDKSGLMVYNKRKGGKVENPISEWIISKAEHPGVISSTDWIACQNILDKVRSKGSNRELTGNKFLLSKLLKCGICGSSMCSWSRNNPKTGKYERYYRCELRNRASTRCSCKMLNAYNADTFVIDLIKSIDITYIDNLLNSRKNNTANKLDVKKENNLLNKNLIENKKILSGLVKKLAIFDDLDTLTLIQSEIKKIQAENIILEKSLNDLTLTAYEIEDEEENKNAFIESLNKFKETIDIIEDIDVKRLLISNIVEYFTYNSETEQIDFKLRL